MPTYLITGATSGLGLATAKLIAQNLDAVTLILPVRDETRGNTMKEAILAVTKAPTTTIFTPLIDFASLHDVQHFLSSYSSQLPEGTQLSGIFLNAGVQLGATQSITPEGFEMTFGVNHLSQYLLLQGLIQQQRLTPNCVVVWTSSSTHYPNSPIANELGFRGARWTNFSDVSHGKYPQTDYIDEKQLSRDEYATSKLCNVVSARIFAQRYGTQPNTNWKFFSMCPGVVPETNIIREGSWWEQLKWKWIYPLRAGGPEGISSLAVSSEQMMNMITGKYVDKQENGGYFQVMNNDCLPAKGSRLSRDPALIQEIAQGSDAAIAPYLSTTIAANVPAKL